MGFTYFDGTYYDLRLTRSVGSGCANLSDDVSQIQAAMNMIASVWGAPEDSFQVDGNFDSTVSAAIHRFQKRQFGFHDGNIAPGGKTVAKLEQIIARKAVDIVVIDGGGGANDAMALAREFWDGELQVSSVSDMVTKVLHLLDADTISRKKIRSLAVCGHGGPGIQGCGCGHDPDINGYRALMAKGDGDGLKGNADNELSWLYGEFAPDAVVMLDGCRVAANTTWHDGSGPYDGKLLLKAISRALGGVWVEGSEYKQNLTPGMEGNCIRCNGYTCGVITGRTTDFWGPMGGSFQTL
jgi:hypothetical protein